jgi:acyl-CoA synthetase (AMP-forming)/AMP-acid ligase II
MVSHGNLLHNLQQSAHRLDLTADTRGVAWLPPYHDMGLIGGILAPLYAGFPAMLMSPLAFLKRPLRWLEAITEFRATVSAGPNFAYELCTRKIKDDELRTLDLTSWRVASMGRNLFVPKRWKDSPTSSPPVAFAGTHCRVTDLPSRRCTSLASSEQVDRLCWTLMQMRSPRTVLLGSGQRSLCAIGGCERLDRRSRSWIHRLCGPVLRRDRGNLGERTERCKDTGRNPRSPREVFQTEPQTASLDPAHGDLGLLKDELYVTGRLKALIIIDGRNIYPQDIEHAAQRLPGLRPGAGMLSPSR